MLQPKRTKHRRSFRTKHDCVASRGKKLSFGAYGLQAITSAWVTNRQIEATRIAITRAMGREGKVWIRIFPHLSKTTKPIGVRMGSGKGTPDKWVAVVKRETVMFEIDGISREAGLRALRLGKYKLPLKSRVIEREAQKC